MQIAQEESLRTEEVVISATKTPQPLQEVTSSVQVITGDELEQRKIRTVVDALRQFGHGMAVFSNGGPGTLAQVRIRGAQPRHTLVVIDGTIVNSPTDGAFNFANLTAENIERIEILRGAQSMLWGSDAIGGVINIITKKGRGKPSAGGFVEYGSFATIRESVQASGAKGPFDFSASLLRWDTSSFSAVNYRRGAIERDGFHHWQASSQLGVALPKDGRLEFNLRWWNSDVNLDSAFGNTRLDVLGSRQTTRNLLLSSIYTQPITSWWSQKFLVAQTNEHVLFDSGTFQRNLVTGVVSPVFPFPGDIEILNRRLEWQHNFVVAKPLLLTAGYQFREDQGDAGGSFGIEQPNRLLSSHAGFAQAQFNYQERLLLTAGVRHDDYNVFGVATTYRLTGGYVLKETGTKIRTSYGTGFRAPTLNDLFFQGANNPNLKPEESKSLDVGVDQHFLKERLLLSGTYFWNRFENLIQFVSAPGCPPSAFGTCPQNTQQAKSQGWEARAEYTILENLYIWGQYTYTLTRDLTTGNRLARWPVHQANAGVSYRPIDRVAIHVDYRYVGSRFNDPANTQGLDPFGVVNAAATYDVTKQVQLYGRVENLFNEKYEEILFFGTPIRSVFGGVRITL
ncbi:MAG: TonB-dependent receptor [Nitrospiraceae bacterium]|nr:TonB-dependent receptor [Nitrospiraceae bacterium]